MFKFLEKIILKFHKCENNLKTYSMTKETNGYGHITLMEIELKCDICNKIFKSKII
jgi:hypothetical protein